jgi:hypothetical protein
MNSHVILYRAHKMTDAVRREVKILKEQLPDCDVVVVGYATQPQDFSDLPAGVEFFLYDRAALEGLEYALKLQHVKWESTTGHNDLPIMRFFRDRPYYEYYWIIEYDVRYTGNWAILFEDLKLSNADLLGTNVMDFDEAPHWAWWSRDELPVSIVPLESRLKIFAPFMRISMRLLNKVDAKYRTGWSGHYEMTLPTICKWSGLVVEDLGGNGRYTPRARLDKHYLSNTTSWALFPGTFLFRPSFSDSEIRQFGKELAGKPMLWHPIKD